MLWRAIIVVPVLLAVLSGCDAEHAAAAGKAKSEILANGPKNALPVLSASLLDGFEGPENSVWAFDSADDEADAQYVDDNRTQGNKALKVSLRQKGAKGKLHLRRDVELDLAQASALLVDVTAPSDKFSIALAIKSNPGEMYQEIRPVSLKEGMNRGVRFAFDAKDWKHNDTKWEYTGSPVNLDQVIRVMLLIFTGSEASGSLTLDNLQVEGISADAALRATPKSAYREWRPQILLASGLPSVLPQYQTMEVQTIFRASYRDIFDSSDLAFGMRVTTPSGRNLDVRGFFGGMMKSDKALIEADGAVATQPLWGPLEEEKKKDGKDKDKEKDKTEKKAEPPKETDPAQYLPVWLLRYTPSESGRYTCQIYVRNSVGETRATEKSFVVIPDTATDVPPGRKGGNVRVSRTDPRQLELQDGSPFYILGQNVCWTQDWAPYLQKIKAYGGNTMRVWLCPWGLMLERKTEPGVYDLQSARRLDKLLAAAESSGVRIIFCFTFHGMTRDFWYESPYNQANGGPCARPQDFFTDNRARTQFKRLLSYAASRWGSSPALLSWELINEMDLAGFDRPDSMASWTREMASHLKGADVHGHLLTTSSTNVNFLPELWQDSRLDFVSVHAYGTDVAAMLSRYAAPYRTLAKPHLLAEFGGGWQAADDIPDKDGARLQAALWLTACSQSCGAALPWWWDTYIETRNLYPILAGVGNFLAGDDRRGRFDEWVHKTYSGGVDVDGVMDNHGARLYVHNPGWTRTPESRGAALINEPLPLKLTGLLGGQYHVEFWDAREGKMFSSSDLAVTDGNLTLQLPARAAEFGIKVERKARSRPGLE